MLLNKNEIETVIPQRKPFVMVDELLYADEVKTITSFTPNEKSIFSEKDFFSENGLLENIAQTAAAGVGYICKVNNVKVPIGFIANVKQFEVLELPKLGNTITTEVEKINEVMDVTIVKGKVSYNSKIIVNCELRILIKK